MMKHIAWLRRIDSLCASLNAGLTAVAVVLTVVFAIQLTVRTATLLNNAQQQLAAYGGNTLQSSIVN
jgi:hypothetical protein